MSGNKECVKVSQDEKYISSAWKFYILRSFICYVSWEKESRLNKVEYAGGLEVY